MKLHTDRVDIERSNVGAETEFKIKTTAKAFDILSSGLYTDNILAIVRELSCNAYDAHVAAKREDTPFEIHLPNRLEPFFAVKDFGTGLSHDQVMSLYTTYFDSTKTDSNDFIGALGLGSKSPFSYTKSFEVISRYEGLRRIYSVFINEEGVPTIVQMGDAIPTDEHNGLEVKLTVNPDEAYKFENKTAAALRWFPTKPNVVGVTNFQFDEPPKTDVQGDGWYLHGGGSYYNSGKITAVQGNVEYRVDLEQLEDLDSSVRAFLKRTNLIAFFDIGELEVAASREEIRYDARTKVAITKKIHAVHAKALKDVEDEAKDYDGLWNAIVKLDQKGRTIFRDEDEFRKFVSVSSLPILTEYAKSHGRVKVQDPQGYDIYMYNWGRYGSGANLSRMKGRTFEPKAGTIVFINDVKTGGIKRIGQYLRDTGNSQVIIITPHKHPIRFTKKVTKKGETMVQKPMSPAMMKKELKRITNELGDPALLYADKDTDPVRRIGTSVRNKAIFQYYDYQVNDYRPNTVIYHRPDPEDFDFEAGGLYFDLERKTKIKYNGHTIDWSASSVGDNLEAAVNIINIHQGNLDDEKWNADTQLFGVGSLDVKKFEKADNWYNLFDLLGEAVAKYKASAEAALRWSHTKDYLGLKDAVRKDGFTNRIYSTLDKTSPLRILVELYHDGYKASKSVALPHTFFVQQFDRMYGKKELENLDESPYVEEANLSGTYPLIEYLGDLNSNTYSLNKLTKVLDYINLIDRS